METKEILEWLVFVGATTFSMRAVFSLFAEFNTRRKIKRESAHLQAVTRLRRDIARKESAKRRIADAPQLRIEDVGIIAFINQ